MDQPQARDGEDAGIVQTNLKTLTHIFTTNDPPSQIEVAMLQEGATTLAAQIRRLYLDLAPLEEQLLLHRIGLSPIRRVPPEILLKIFSHAGWRAAKHITLVCRAWHEAFALSSIVPKHHSNLSIRNRISSF
ncbi:hypothetical protein NMY22_g12726 [Coprinellus aureogranulatus]|nr:hypothetical protein NMY22_g12726 [Coprinellus aureogranulatus]